MGIWERPPEHFLDALQAEFGFDPPREHGLDTVESIRALRDGKAHVFIGLGGNFVQAAPDTDVTREAMEKADLTVQISTKLNRSHLTPGDTALILPTLGRTEKDVQATGEQFVSVEDSMSAVHASRGVLAPASPHLRSEVAIVCGIAHSTLGPALGWEQMTADYSRIRDHISRVVVGCDDYEAKVDRPGGFVLPHGPRDSREFPTASGKAEIAVSPIDVLQVPDGHLLLQTLRSHDQFNTTIYGLSDRYRGIEGGRRVVFVHPDDVEAFGLSDGSKVDLVGHWEDDDVERVARGFRVVPYETPRGTAASYYPETNPLVPLDSTAEGSNCPASKSVIVKLKPVPPGAGPDDDEGGQDSVHADEGHKTRQQPRQLS
jgi:formate dehydrogenase major subunit